MEALNFFKVLVVFFIACWFGMAMAENRRVHTKTERWDGTERRIGIDRRVKGTYYPLDRKGAEYRQENT